MNIKKKEELIDQYEDAAFALMMSNYAEEEGARLLQEFEEAKARGTVPPVPEELDKKCRMRIRRAYQKARTRARIRRSVRVIGKSAAVLLIAIGLCATLIVSVDALRIPVFNFFFEQYEEFTTVNFGKDPASSSTQPTADAPESESGETPLDGILGEEYRVVHYAAREDGTFVVYYQNNIGEQVMLSCTAGDATINIDSSKDAVNTITILGCDGLLVEENNKSTILWYSETHKFAYLLQLSSGSASEAWQIAEKYILASEGE